MTERTLPTIVPMLTYEDVGGAADWLCSAFGFTESERFEDGDGLVNHATLLFDGGAVMLGRSSPDYQNPRHHADVCEVARKWQRVPFVVDGVLVFVEDVDDHSARAVAAGALVLSGVEEGGVGRLYRVEDPEGHRWMFLERRAPTAEAPEADP